MKWIIIAISTFFASGTATAQQHQDEKGPIVGRKCEKDRECGWRQGYICQPGPEGKRCVRGCRVNGDCGNQEVCAPIRTCSGEENCPKVCFKESELRDRKPKGEKQTACLGPSWEGPLTFSGAGALMAPTWILAMVPDAPPAGGIFSPEKLAELALQAYSSGDAALLFLCTGLLLVMGLTWLTRHFGEYLDPWFSTEGAGVILSLIHSALVTLVGAAATSTPITLQLVVAALLAAAGASGFWSWIRKAKKAGQARRQKKAWAVPSR